MGRDTTRRGESKKVLDRETSEEANKIIEEEKQKCVERGVDPESGKRGKCHVFLDHSDVCVCGEIDLAKERMK